MPKHKTGTFLGVPYNWTRPRWGRIKARVWNPDDRRVRAPRPFGWGWSLNLNEALRRLKIAGRRG